MRLPEDQRVLYEDAAEKEYLNWNNYSSARPLTRQEALEVLKDQNLCRRILRSRNCYRDKNVGRGPVRAKARTVVIGCSDPDLAELERTSPTPSRISLMLILQIYASGKGDGWILFGSDATAAFLQGGRGTRKDRLFMFPPRDPISQARNCFPAGLYEIVGNVYGLANAPLEWAWEVIQRMTTLGFSSIQLTI